MKKLCGIIAALGIMYGCNSTRGIQEEVWKTNPESYRDKPELPMSLGEVPLGYKHEVKRNPLFEELEKPKDINDDVIRNCKGPENAFYNSLKELIENHEGRRSFVYDDATGKRLKPGDECKGNRTIGVGFNLDRYGAKSVVESYGLDFNTVYNGEKPLLDNVINDVLDKDIKHAQNIAVQFAGPKWNDLSQEKRMVLIDMAFNLGYGLNEFENMQDALRKGDYETTAKEMIDSKWYGQVGIRGETLSSMMRN